LYNDGNSSGHYVECQKAHADTRKHGGGMRRLLKWLKRRQSGKWKKENTKEARKKYKKSRQNAKRVISSAVEKKQKECAK